MARSVPAGLRSGSHRGQVRAPPQGPISGQERTRGSEDSPTQGAGQSLGQVIRWVRSAAGSGHPLGQVRASPHGLRLAADVSAVRKLYGRVYLLGAQLPSDSLMWQVG